MNPARKRMKLEDGSTSINPLLEPSATMNDLPSEVLKNIFSFIGKGNYCFIGPVSKDFCFNYLTMDVIEDKFAHKMDYLQAIGKNKVTTTEAASSSFELAEYCFLKAPEVFQEQVVKKAILKGRKDIVEIGHAMGIDIDNLYLDWSDVRKIVEQDDLEMIKLLHKMSSQISENVIPIIETAASNGQLGLLKWMKNHTNLLENPGGQKTLLLDAARSGNLEIIKWAKDVAGFKYQKERDLIDYAAVSGKIELVKYLRSKEIPWNQSTFRHAASSGNIAMLQYLLENECPHDDPWICSNAIGINDHDKALEVLKWLHEHDIPWYERACNTLASIGNLKALKYARLNG